MSKQIRKEYSSASRRGGKGSKIERIADEYDLSGLGDELVFRWLGENGYERESLRDLADRVNNRLIHAAVDDSLTLLDGEAENIRRLLTDDDVTMGERTETRQNLKHKGIDINHLESSLISYQSVYNYFKRDRNISRKSQETTQDPTSSLEPIQKLANRLRAIVTNNIDQWTRKNVVTDGSYDVDVAVWITCQDCGERWSPAAFLDESGCQCTNTTEC
ncbi:rod-determining factor RdfA [Haloquadratum walsbyi]|jgi:hypothetical protein|uniref:Uncharacterized protein n=1 Tax=Haloquadratum walsbyi (strain DSM 16854 / JCM 12705 / C23) TaxID=768065 RepID=G0LIZ9_HALWC|nr:rod-determining factor RdfA [Haloquadratum walsbyi]CCC40567.1 uncharacterized protein Hqrw_2741 [Haloquadratum walsbyi C23]